MRRTNNEALWTELVVEGSQLAGVSLELGAVLLV